MPFSFPECGGWVSFLPKNLISYFVGIFAENSVYFTLFLRKEGLSLRI
jgi:hypothetical protein